MIRPASPSQGLRPAHAVKRLAQVSTLAIAASLGGCAAHLDGYSEVKGYVLTEAAERHPITLAEREVMIDIAVAPHQAGLAPYQHAEVADFARDYKRLGSGRLAVMVPSGSVNESAAARVYDAIRHAIIAENVPAGAILVESYYADREPHPPIRLSYNRQIAQAPDCGDWSEDLGDTRENLPFLNLGCATQANFANQVANPADLLGPRGMGPRASERRDVTWDKYVKGETTVSEKSEEEKAGTVSDVGGQ